MKLTITKVVKNDTNKAGDPYIGKNGRPYSRASIKTTEYGDVWLGGFWSVELQDGASIEAEVTEREYNGKMYKDFKLAKKADSGPAANNAATAEIKNILTLKVIPMLEAIHTQLTTPKEQPHNSDPEAIDDAFESAFPD